MQVKQISENEIYLLIKYTESVLWTVAKRLSYIEDARCLKVKDNLHIGHLCSKSSFGLQPLAYISFSHFFEK